MMQIHPIERHKERLINAFIYFSEIKNIDEFEMYKLLYLLDLSVSGDYINTVTGLSYEHDENNNLIAVELNQNYDEFKISLLDCKFTDLFFSPKQMATLTEIRSKYHLTIDDK